MEDSVPPSPGSLVRKCANIKSRKVPDMQCKLNATQGDYCTRHWKHPHKFVQKTDCVYITVANRKELKAICTIQRAWRRISPFLFIKGHGIGFYQKNNSINGTEVLSLEPVDQIPNIYYFSYVDSKNNLWSFDIRSLGQIISFGDIKQNPYTRDPFTPSVLTRIRNRLTWLRKRKYSVVYPIGVELTQDQLWSQKVLDYFMKIESFGYYVSCEWFTNMSIEDHKKFYKTLYELWNYRLGLTPQDRLKIAPGSKPLFKYVPDDFDRHRVHTIQWWERLSLSLIEALLTRSLDKEQQKLGAMYCVMGLFATVPVAAESFPWMAEII
jgi:hypothetical protein